MATRFEEVSGWGAEESWDRDVTGVAVDSRDNVYVLRHGANAITVLDPGGTVVDRWGRDFSERPHMIAIGDDDTIYVTDDGGHRVYVFDRAGHLLDTIGTGLPSETGFDLKAPSTEAALDRMPGAGPFNRPTNAAPSPAGELFVSDGYRNCRVHRFSADRRLIQSWGGPGADPGCFVIPHSVAVDGNGQVLVCDRENDRIQIFTPDGALTGILTDVQRPTDLAFDRRGNMYVSELARGPTDLRSWRLGPAEHERLGRVTVWNSERAIIGRMESPAAMFLAPHAIAVDSTGAVYVAEVPESFARSSGRPVLAHRCLHKFAPH